MKKVLTSVIVVGMVVLITACAPNGVRKNQSEEGYWRSVIHGNNN